MYSKEEVRIIDLRGLIIFKGEVLFLKFSKRLKKGESFVHESYIGSKFTGRIEEETEIQGIKAIVPSIQGWAKVYGYNEIIIDDKDDPYALGFQVL